MRSSLNAFWLLSILIIIGVSLLRSIYPIQIYAAPPSNFQTTQVVGSGLTLPTGFDIAPDGRIFILQQNGVVRVFKNGQLLAQPFIQLPTSQAGGDLGLLGIAFDPDFHLNHYVYFYYTTENSHNKIVRYDASGDVAPSQHLIVFESQDVVQQFHAGGTIAFGPDKKLYLSVGDNGYPPNAQNLSNPAGKILRFNSDGTIPSDNPFVGQSGKLPEIWAYGLRNPFRFQFDKNTGKLYAGDVGNSQTEEINVITKGANYGWPACEGACSVTGMSNPLYSYPHSGISSSVTGGFINRGSQFPQSYENTYFFGDYARGFIRTLTLDSSGNLLSSHDFDLEAGAVVDMKQAQDGSFYYVTIYPGRLYQVTYSTSNKVPTAKSSVNTTQGSQPLTVQFSSQGSVDPEGLQLSYSWDFGDGTTSTQANPSKTYNNQGTYTVQLTVSDGTHTAQAVPIVVQVGTPPVITITQPNTSLKYKAGDTITYSATAKDSNNQNLPDSAFASYIIFHHSTHTHPFLGPLENTRSGEFIVPDVGEGYPDTFYEIKIVAEDNNALVSSKSVNVLPNIVDMKFVTEPANLKVILDSQAIFTPSTVQSVENFKREVSVPAMQLLNGQYYQFDSWSDGGGHKHFVTPNGASTTYTAHLRPTPAFSASYYNNGSLSGNPVLTRNEGMIDYQWDSGSPHSSVNADNFSARWVKQHYFPEGEYKFDIAADDAVRLYIDGQVIIDTWTTGNVFTGTANHTFTDGNHEIKLEYREDSGAAEVKLIWEPVSTSGETHTHDQEVTSFSLINATSDQVIAGYEQLTEGQTINLANLPTRSLNIRANTDPSVVGSVRFAYDSNANYQTETNAPYALASDEGGDYYGWTPTLGAHTVTATPFTQAGGAGEHGTAKTVRFSVIDQGSSTPTPSPSPGGQSITSFTLINADTEQPITQFDPIPAGAVINLASLPTQHLNIRANTNPTTVGSVRFAYDGNSNYQTETNAPYALASDEGGNYYSWTPAVGSHTVTATPFTQAGGGGTAGTAMTLTFSITNGGSPTPTPTPTPSPSPGGQSVISFSLINAETDAVIAGYDTIPNGQTISLSSLPTRNINIRANTDPATVGSVRFAYDGNTNFQTETNTPYALASDEGGDYYEWTPATGAHTVTATPYTQAGGGGTAGASSTLTFSITN